MFFNRPYCLFYLLTTTALSVLCPHASMAQPQSTDEILAFSRHEIDFNSKVGTPLGGFMITPGITYNAIFDDNIFLKENNLTSDFISIYKPGVAVQTNWGRHEIYAGLQASKKDYKKNNQKDSLDYGAILSGRYDITYETFIDGYVSKSQRNLNRGSEEDVDGTVPIKYDSLSSRIGFTRQLSYIQAKVAAFHDQTDRKDTLSSALTGDFLTREKNGLEGTLTYEYFPKNNLFVSLSQSNIDYNLFGGSSRNVNKSDLKYGLNFSYWEMYSGSVYFGHLRTDYSHIEQASNDPYTGFTVNWNPTRLTSVAFSMGRSYADGSISADEKVVIDNAKLVLTHQITDFVTGSVTMGAADNSYQALSGGTLRENRVYSLGTDAQYKMSDNLGFKVGYDYRKRVSDIVNEDYQSNRILFTLTYMN